MKILLLLLPVLFLSSCVHTAIAPVATPEGVPVVIRVPGARWGKEVNADRIAVIDLKVDKEIAKQIGSVGEVKKDPAILAAGPVGFYGDVRSKRGEKFIGYAPMIFIRSTYPPEAVDRAAAQLAAAYYRAAKKHFQVIPITEIASKPTEKKP